MLAPAASQLRFRSLDGLRGFAAVIVLAHHLSMTIPLVSNGYDSSKNLTPFSWGWWMVASPFKIFVAGPEFVLVFFVLSGFVLTLAPLGGSYSWASYYPRRIIRLGIPAVVSMFFALAAITVLPHPVTSSDGSWLTRQANPDISARNLITESLLIVDPSRPTVNPPLWSLTWEVWFSLLLPVAVVIALWSRRLPVLWALLLCGTSVFGYLAHSAAAMYLPAFGLGALLAANAHRIRAAVDRWQGRRGFTIGWIVVAVAGPMLSISYWMLRPLLHGHAGDAALAMRVPGAVLMVATVAFWPAVGRVFETKPLAWLGKISFSLYLVHSPVVVGFGLIFSGQDWWIGAILSVLVSFGLALVMYTLVERPSQRLASWIGKLSPATPDDIRRRQAGARTLSQNGS